MWLVLLIGLLVVAAIIVFLATHFVSSTLCGGMKSGYDPAQITLAQKLMTEIAPKVAGKIYTKEMIDAMVGNSPLFDQVMYFNFRRMIESGKREGDMMRLLNHGVSRLNK